jgi:hypothetical protein
VTEVSTLNNEEDLGLADGGETPLSLIEGKSGIEGSDSGEKAACRASLDERGCLHVGHSSAECCCCCCALWLLLLSERDRGPEEREMVIAVAMALAVGKYGRGRGGRLGLPSTTQ